MRAQTVANAGKEMECAQTVANAGKEMECARKRLKTPGRRWNARSNGCQRRQGDGMRREVARRVGK